MSCFVVSKQSSAELAAFIEEVCDGIRYGNRYVHGIDIGRELYEEFQSRLFAFCGEKPRCLCTGHYYAILREMNHDAFFDRYGEYEDFEGMYKISPDDMPEPKRIWRTNPLQMFKHMECYLYQCCEGNWPETKLYELLKTMRNQYAYHILHSMPEYEAAVWD